MREALRARASIDRCRCRRCLVRCWSPRWCPSSPPRAARRTSCYPISSPTRCAGTGSSRAARRATSRATAASSARSRPGWVCTSNVCTQVCGDGVVGTGTTCANPHRDTDCDMTGYWTVSETDYTCDDIFHQPQTSTNWYLYHFVQQGTDFHVDAELDCGVHVTGSATVDYTPSTLEPVMYLNAMDGSGSHPAPARHLAGDRRAGAPSTLDRWYKIRGATDDLSARGLHDGAAALVAPGAPDGERRHQRVGHARRRPRRDGSGRRRLRRDGVPDHRHRERASATPSSASGRSTRRRRARRSRPRAISFDVPGGFDLQESILHVSDCGTGCGLLTTGAAASKAPGRITFVVPRQDPRAARAWPPSWPAPPRQNVTTDLATCANVRAALPHDTTAPSGACPQSSP